MAREPDLAAMGTLACVQFIVRGTKDLVLVAMVMLDHVLPSHSLSLESSLAFFILFPKSFIMLHANKQFQPGRGVQELKDTTEGIKGFLPLCKS